MRITDHIKRLFVTRPSVLAEILSTETSREELLGMQSVEPPTQERILEDANRIVSYSSKQDYRVWSKEAWAKALSHLDAIQNPKATTDEVNFHRGALTATLNLLRISSQARAVKDDLERDMNKNVSSAR